MKLDIKNSEFLSALFDDLAPDETCWTAAFGASPKDATDANWAGQARLPSAVGSVDLFNQYFSISTLRKQQIKSDTGEVRWGARRDQKHFSRMVCVVLDDAGELDFEPTWRVETSAGNYQIGYRLEDPITDVRVAQRFCKALVAQRVIENDKSGNNPVRYVRLPVGSNTKGDTAFKCALKVWNPARRVTLAELCAALNIDPDTLARDAQTESKAGTKAKSGANPFEDKCAELGRRLRDGDGRYALMTSYIGAKVRARLSEAEIWRLVEGAVETYFDPEDPPSSKNLRAYKAIINGLEQKDAARENEEKQFSSETNRNPLVEGIAKRADAFMAKRLGEKKAELPPVCDELLKLPYGLGVIQDYVYGRLMYPSRSIAGLTAFAALSALAMPNVKIKSFQGLAINEQYVVLAPTGTGKDDIRKALIDLVEAGSAPPESAAPAGNLQFNSESRVGVLRNLPGSQQALHKELEHNKNLLIMADEVAEWFAAARNNATRQEAQGYMMQVYTSPFGVVIPPQSMIGKYINVANPRLALFATSTAHRMLEVMTGSNLASGAYNRIVWFLPEDNLTKRYEGQSYAISERVLKCLRLVTGLKKDTTVTFSEEAWAYYKEYDSTVVEPLRKIAKHLALGGRMSEQAVRMAAVIALSAGRTVISEDDLRHAYAIRVNLHHRIFAEMDEAGTLETVEQSKTSRAAEKVRRYFSKKSSVTLSELISNIVDFGKKLDVNEREQVMRSLVAEGVCEPTPRVTKGGRYNSLIYSTGE